MTEESIKIIIIDDHITVHKALADMISFVDDFVLVAQGSNGLEAIELCNEFSPDVVLMDVVMPGLDGIEATRQILEANPDIKILALSSFQDNDSVNAMLENGASGYILKHVSTDELEDIIRTVYRGNSVIDSQLMQRIMQQTTPRLVNDFQLSSRELEILKLIAGGLSYIQIGDQLTISLSTVKFHVGNILTKLNVETRNEAIHIAAKNNII